MSDQKRATLTTLGTSKSDKKSKEVQRKTIRLNLTLTEPNEDSYPVFKYPTLLNAEEKKLRLKESRGEGGKTLNGSFNSFDDDDEESIRRIARQFEQKYGGGDRRHNRCHTYAELGAGYDETDSFIDNTEAYEEALPEEMQTAHGGYYINCGQLEFKRVEVSDHSDLDEVKARRKHKKGVKVIDDEEGEEEEAEEGDEDDEAAEDEDEEAAEDNEEEKPAEPSPKPVEPPPPSLPKKVKIAEEPLLPPPPPAQPQPAAPPPPPPADEPPAAPSVEVVPPLKLKRPVQCLEQPEGVVPPLKLKRPVQCLEQPEPIKKKKKQDAHWVDMSAVLAKKAKKKALTVKALLEEKRVLETTPLPPNNVSETLSAVRSKNPVTSHIIDTIESVVNAGGHSDDSCTSSAGTKSQSVPSSETEDSEEAKSNNLLQSKPSPLAQNSTVVPPLPDNLSSSLLEVIVSIKHAASTSDSTRKNFSSDVNTPLVMLEKKSRDLPAPSRHSLYAHLACFLPCTKDTLMKRAKKLFIQGEEEKMKEPMRKLKLAIDRVMPSLLERFEKDYQKFLQEKKNEIPTNGDSVTAEEKKNDSLPLSKLPRKKFPWTEEMRGYLRELIRLRLQCFHVLKPRKETAEEYVSKFLNTHVRVLWPQGWMKTSTLLRESRESTTVIKPKKTSHNRSDSSKNLSSTGRLPSNISLPSSTTLTPTNGTSLTSRSSENNYRPKKAQAQPVITPTAAHAAKSGPSNSAGLFSQLTSSATSTPLCLSPATSVSRTTTPSPPKKIQSPGANSTLRLSPIPVKMEPKQEGFSVDALLKRTNTENFKLEEQFKSEPTDLSKKESVSVITMNGSAMPFKELSQGKGGRIPENTSASDKILDLSNCSVKSEPLQQPSVIKSVSSSNDRTTIRNSESVNSSSVFNNHNNSSMQLPPKIRESVVTSTPVSRKQRILQDTIKSDVSANSTQESSTDNIVSKKKNKKTDQKDVTPKKKIKLKIEKERSKLDVTSPPSAPAPLSVVDPHEAERRLHEETATATDILSQIISESLLGTPHQPTPAFDDEIRDRERDERSIHVDDRRKKQRTTSGDQEAKVKMEVDQVIQDLVELRQMSGGGNSENTLDSTKSSTFGNNSVNIHKKPSHDETSKHSTFTSYQDEFYKHLLKKDSLPKSLSRTVGSYQDEFYKHLLEQDSSGSQPKTLSNNVGSYDSLHYVGEIPVKSHFNSVSSHHSNQSSPSPHQVLVGNKTSPQSDHGNSVNKTSPTVHAASPGQQHRPMYFPQIGFNSDDQHTNLLNLPSGLQFNWSFPGTNESSSPH